MIKNVILQHKLEKERLSSKTYVFREKLNFAKDFAQTDLIKLISSPRRV